MLKLQFMFLEKENEDLIANHGESKRHTKAKLCSLGISALTFPFMLLSPSTVYAKGGDGNAIGGVIFLFLFVVLIYALIRMTSSARQSNVQSHVKPTVDADKIQKIETTDSDITNLGMEDDRMNHLPTNASPEEKKQYLDKYTKEVLERAAALNPIPIKSTLPLKRGELCYLVLECDAYEIIEVTTNVKYSIPQIKFGRGMFTWRFGDAQFDRQKGEKVFFIGHGNIFMTNKRLFFDCGVKNFVLPFSQILKVDSNLIDNRILLSKIKGGVVDLIFNKTDLLQFIVYYHNIRSTMEKGRAQN